MYSFSHTSYINMTEQEADQGFGWVYEGIDLSDLTKKDVIELVKEQFRLSWESHWPHVFDNEEHEDYWKIKDAPFKTYLGWIRYEGMGQRNAATAEALEVWEVQKAR